MMSWVSPTWFLAIITITIAIPLSSLPTHCLLTSPMETEFLLFYLVSFFCAIFLHSYPSPPFIILFPFLYLSLLMFVTDSPLNPFESHCLPFLWALFLQWTTDAPACLASLALCLSAIRETSLPHLCDAFKTVGQDPFPKSSAKGRSCGQK